MIIPSVRRRRTLCRYSNSICQCHSVASIGYSLRLLNGNLAPIPLTIFRSNSKLYQNLKSCGWKCNLPITTTFRTRHDSVTVVTCAKFRCDQLCILKTTALQILIDSDWQCGMRRFLKLAGITILFVSLNKGSQCPSRNRLSGHATSGNSHSFSEATDPGHRESGLAYLSTVKAVKGSTSSLLY